MIAKKIHPDLLEIRQDIRQRKFELDILRHNIGFGGYIDSLKRNIEQLEKKERELKLYVWKEFKDDQG